MHIYIYIHIYTYIHIKRSLAHLDDALHERRDGA